MSPPTPCGRDDVQTERQVDRVVLSLTRLAKNVTARKAKFHRFQMRYHVANLSKVVVLKLVQGSPVWVNLSVSFRRVGCMIMKNRKSTVTLVASESR